MTQDTKKQIQSQFGKCDDALAKPLGDFILALMEQIEARDPEHIATTAREIIDGTLKLAAACTAVMDAAKKAKKGGVAVLTSAAVFAIADKSFALFGTPAETAAAASISCADYESAGTASVSVPSPAPVTKPQQGLSLDFDDLFV